MKSYTIPVNVINRFSDKDFNLYSFSARDYRKLLIENKKTIQLKDLLEQKQKVGREIGSEAYMNKSKYRFLKTVNISSNFLLEESSVEYCKPENKVFPKKNEILIAKDGGGNGLGEVALYPHENKENADSLSAGIIAIKIKDEKINYVLGFLKSQHFKDFIDLNTAQGSTIRHSKLISLDYEIPFPTTKNHSNPDKIEVLVSLIVQNIIDKEKQIKLKNKQINELIQKELKDNQKMGNFSFNYPRISEIREEARLDTGLYEKEFKEINFLIRNYKGGFSFIDEKNIEGGNTPKERIFGKGNLWLTPTDCKKGILVNKSFIKSKKYNLHDDCLVIVNRSNVAETILFEKNIFKIGHHNQGMYRVKIDKNNYNYFLFILSWLNSSIFQKYIACVATGATFKEIRIDDISKKSPIPNFPATRQKEIIQLYYKLPEKSSDLNFENYLIKETKRNSEAGIFQLNMEIFNLREKLEDILHRIITCKKIDISF